MTTATLRNWGGSLALPIPKPLLELMGFSSGQKVAFTVQTDGLLLKPVESHKPQHMLAQLMREHEAMSSAIDPDWIDAPMFASEQVL